jgi:adenylate cyclase
MMIVGALCGFAAAMPESLARRWMGALGIAMVILSGVWLTLRFGRLWVSPAEPLVALGASFASLGITDFAVEQRRRRTIHAAFGQYLAPVLVDRLASDPGLVKLSGERKMMTILFADVRGFTTISETMQSCPEELTTLINQILEPLSDAVLKHGGTIDKYVGDCVMAFWNAPIDDPDHARHAVAAALDMIDAMPELNRQLTGIQGDLPAGRVDIGVGINTGECVVGNMGTARRFNYSVVGDAVNVASRLEGLSKDYGAPIIVGEATVELAEQDFIFEELDNVAVRGSRRAQTIYRVSRRRSGGEP